MNYKEAGVDIQQADRFVDRLREIVSIDDDNVVGGLGGFGGAYRVGSNLLIAATDGVGTKLQIARLTGKHDTVGIDLVAMCVNDILTLGARPLFFLDYVSIGVIDNDLLVPVVSGIQEGCRQSGAALLGGETAEHPGLMSAGEYDLAGFSVGLVPENEVIDGTRVQPGDTLIGLPSSGIHSNGYSLVRHLFFKTLGWTVDRQVDELGMTLGEALLTPTIIYVKSVLSLLEQFPDNLHGMAHITGGGFRNIQRMNESLGFDLTTVPDCPPIFPLIQKLGGIETEEMYQTFNMGVGMVLVTDRPDDVLAAVPEGSCILGTVTDTPGVRILPLDITYA
jgi:phosphoribosylformylglycinamidine cyclo-ligase